LIKDPAPTAKPPEIAKPAVFVLRGGTRSKQELDGSVATDPANPTGDPEATKPNAQRATPFTRTNPSTPQ
jgi:hypothetical protein